MAKRIFNYTTLPSGAAEIKIYGDIVATKSYKWEDDDFCPADMAAELDGLGGKNVNLYINSCGGDVFAGYAIYNSLKRYKEKYGARITTYVDGIAASIASVIALSGDKIVMPANSYLMIHRPWIQAAGDAAAVAKAAELLQRVEEGIVDTYVSHAAEEITADFVRSLMEAETWLTPSEAEEIFPAAEESGIIDIAAKIADSGQTAKLPEAIRAASDERQRENIVKKYIAEMAKGEETR